MQTADSLEKTLLLGKIEGKRRRGWQRMRWVDSIADSMDMSLSKLQETEKDRKHGMLRSWGCKESDTTQQLNNKRSVKSEIILLLSSEIIIQIRFIHDNEMPSQQGNTSRTYINTFLRKSQRVISDLVLFGLSAGDVNFPPLIEHYFSVLVIPIASLSSPSQTAESQPTTLYEKNITSSPWHSCSTGNFSFFPEHLGTFKF